MYYIIVRLDSQPGVAVARLFFEASTDDEEAAKKQCKLRRVPTMVLKQDTQKFPRLDEQEERRERIRHAIKMGECWWHEDESKDAFVKFVCGELPMVEPPKKIKSVEIPPEVWNTRPFNPTAAWEATKIAAMGGLV